MGNHLELAAASITGRQHRVSGRNNQDAYHYASDGERMVAVVCDGCGSGRHSEVGAALGSRLIVKALMHNQISEDNVETQLEQTRLEVLAHLLALAEAMGGCLAHTLSEYFLFTVVGLIKTPTVTTFFALGDGIIIVNNESFPLGPFPGNAPPYLAYGLLPCTAVEVAEQSFHFQLPCVLPTPEVESFLIGTDGALDLMRAAGRQLPGRNDIALPVQRLWQDDSIFTNPDALRRHLAAVNRDVTAFDRTSGTLHREHGLLPDDTTLIVGRRPRQWGGGDREGD